MSQRPKTCAVPQCKVFALVDFLEALLGLFFASESQSSYNQVVMDGLAGVLWQVEVAELLIDVILPDILPCP